MNENYLYQNCELWAKFNPKQAILLPYMDISHLHFTSTLKGEINLAQSRSQGDVYYHSIEGAAEEALAWFRDLELKNVGLICVYGIGLGYYYEAAQQWLKSDASRQLVFLEDDLSVIHYFFQTEKATALLNHPQIQLLYFKELTIKENVLEELYWNAAMTQLRVSSLGLYTKEKMETYRELEHKLYFDFTLKNALIEEYLEYGARFFLNFYQNIHRLPGAYLGNQMYGKFKNIPAIICGAGPSLSKHIHTLPQLTERALIFAGGSAMNALNAEGFRPHLGAGIDPNPAQIDRIKNNKAYEVPFFYRNRIHPDALNAIQGPHLYITGCGGYDVAGWYEKKFNIMGEDLDEGHNVINFSLQTAKQLGCNPIIFIGVDLGFTDSKTYAPGIEDHIIFSADVGSEDIENKPIKKKDIYGQPLYTLWKWLAESEWIAEFAEENPELTLINCTEGGLGFPGIINTPLAEVIEEYLTREHPIAERLHTEIQNSRLTKVTFKKISQFTTELKESLNKCIHYLSVLLEEARKIQKMMKESNQVPLNQQGGYAALCEIELAEEPGYKYVLEMFNAVKTKLLQHEIHKGPFISEFERVLNKFEVNIKRLSFLKDTAQANTMLIDLALSNLKNTNSPKYNPNSQDEINLLVPSEQGHEGSSLLLPKKAKEGTVLSDGHIIREVREYGKKKPLEVRLEKAGILDGQCLLYYPNGKIKAEMFYKKGSLDGPVTFYSSQNKKITRSFFLEGKRNGYSYLYYPKGSLYARLEYHKGLLDGVQYYFNEKGSLKSRLHFHLGVETQKAELFDRGV